MSDMSPATPICKNVTRHYGFIRVVGLVPDMIGAHELLAHTLRDMGSVDEAIRRYNDITAQRPT